MTRGAGKVLLGLGVPVAGFGGYLLWYAAGRSYFEPALAQQGGGVLLLGTVMLAVGLGKLTKLAVGLGVGVAIAGVAVYVYQGASSRADASASVQRRRAALAAQLWPVCDKGTPVAGAAAYDPAVAGLHPIMVFTKASDGDHYERDTEPGWLPRDLASVQLVGCTEVTREHVAGCTYTGAGSGDRLVSRYQYKATMKVYAARTGELLGEAAAAGSEAPPCPDTKTFGAGGFDDITGSYPSDSDVLGFFAKHARR